MNQLSTCELVPDASETVLVPLSQGYFARVDRADLAVVGGYIWSASVRRHTVYAARTVRDAAGRQHTILLHRAILGANEWQRVDHGDGDGLNNTRGNLRFAGPITNGRNSRLRSNSRSGFKGVEQTGPRSWRASICSGGKRFHLGCYPDPVQAALRYDEAVNNLFGGWGRTNKDLGLLPAVGGD